MIFRQLYDRDSCTFTYLIGDDWSREAILIDPVLEHVDRDLSVLSELGLKLVHTLDTHAHADHITAAAVLRSKTGAKVGYSRASGVEGADRLFDDGDALRFGLQAIEVRSTPGHTSGCVTYVNVTDGAAFTGDALFVRGCGRTDFQDGDSRTLYRSVRDKIFSLPDETLIYPAHDYKGRTVTTVREERNFNPRLGGGRTEDQFVSIMDELDLAYPRMLDVAVPANMRCGLTTDEPLAHAPPIDADEWPVFRTPSGAPNLPAIWVAENCDRVRLIDVRDLPEVSGADGRLDGAEIVPLAGLAEAARAWDRSTRLVLFCRVGGRSDKAALQLEGRGFTHVAGMTGGILRWSALGLPVAGGAQG
jgi:glyoxylase-like metal-dependent hydrolase (beta-lactamase superfamily II)/rhodanese-related sulfurtransferase